MDNWRGPCQCYWMELEAQTAGNINTASLEITAEILALVSEIDDFKGAWRAIGQIVPERLVIPNRRQRHLRLENR